MLHQLLMHVDVAFESSFTTFVFTFDALKKCPNAVSTR